MIPHSLIIENFMSHENSRLDFNQFEAALLIGSKNGDTDISNGVGKTAIFDSIVWVLFDKSRFKTKDRVIKRGKSFCRVEFIFSVENNRYKIIRKFNSKGVTDISIFLQQGSEWKDLTCDTSRVTNKKIIEIVKLNYETFINSVYFKQHDLLRFANARAADRKEILKDLLQIGVWDRYQDRAKSIVRDLKSKKESIDERIISLGNVEDENNILVSKLSNIESLIIETDTDIKNIEKELRKARENLGIVKASLDITKTLEIEKKIKNLEKKGASLLLKKESIKKEAQSVKDNIQQMKENNKTLNEIIKKSAENLIIIEHKGTKKAEKILGKTGEYIEPVDKNLIKKLEKFIILHNQKISNLNEFILNKIETGEIKLTNKLNINVTVHNNCYFKTKGDLYWNVPREILKKCGCNIIEMKHIRQDSLCCGFGAGASWVKNISIPFDIISEGMKKFEEAEATRASALIAYCGGCIYLLWATKELLRKKIDVYHIIEIVRMAMGEKIESKKKHIERAWDIIVIISYSLLVSLLKHNFYIKKISYDKDMTTFKPKRYLLLRIMRILFKVHYIRKIYSKLFILMMPLMKTRLK